MMWWCPEFVPSYIFLSQPESQIFMKILKNFEIIFFPNCKIWSVFQAHISAYFLVFSVVFVEKSWWFRGGLFKHRSSLVMVCTFWSVFLGQLSLFPIINFSSNNSNLSLGLLSILMQFNVLFIIILFLFL